MQKQKKKNIYIYMHVTNHCLVAIHNAYYLRVRRD